MTNYIGADIRRILHKQSFLGAVAVFWGIFAVLVFIYFNPSFTSDMYVAKTTSYLSFFPLLVGLFVFMSIYADDFKCRSMQVAIGYGIAREKIVLAKLLESAILLFGVAAISGVLIVTAPMLIGLDLSQELTISLILTILAETLRALGYIAISTIPVFFSQNATNGIIFYVLLSTKCVYIVLSMILDQEFILHSVGDLTKYLYTAQLYIAKTVFMQNGGFPIETAVALFAYAVIPGVISAVGFRKKELEF